MKFVTWVHDAGFASTSQMVFWYKHVQKHYGVFHWSRVFEYPFAIHTANLRPGLRVLDAAGGDGPLQAILAGHGCKVVNVDYTQKNLDKAKRDFGHRREWNENVELRLEDLRCLSDPDESYDRVLCVSVLEHDFDQLDVLEELWRVLKVGGRLVCTFDLANYMRFNHTIDYRVAEEILERFDLEIPGPIRGITIKALSEVERKFFDPQLVHLATLCFFVDKEES